ncbi:MAG: ammonium transporter [Candidatus Omnitrophica bacterium]|nr:ammonium transporter [Candidatus Omnitrophota bacterium]
MNSGDVAFMLLSTALVLLMTPGLAFFYGGMVRRKNVLSILMQCFIAISVLTVQWMLCGYSLSFAPSHGFWGGTAWFCLNHVGLEPFPEYAATIPYEAFMIFQAMFAIITPALIIGAFAERMRFSAFLVFTVLWATFVYAPVCHWVWGSGGWLKQLGVLDFAGGLVVHTTAGIAALVTTLIIGKRDRLNHTPAPHNLPFVVLGTALLWFGWFGFNAGSALAANGTAVNAFVVTNAAAASAGLSWAILEWIRNGKPTVFGIMTGSIAGLATITPASGFVGPFAGLLIGVFASILCFISISVIKPSFGYDDSLDAFGVHGVGGILGTILTGIFASKAINAAGANGWMYGNFKQLLIQLAGVGAVAFYTFVATFVIYKFVDIFLKSRVSQKEELMGLDLTQHRESAYTIIE